MPEAQAWLWEGPEGSTGTPGLQPRPLPSLPSEGAEKRGSLGAQAHTHPSSHPWKAHSVGMMTSEKQTCPRVWSGIRLVPMLGVGGCIGGSQTPLPPSLGDGLCQACYQPTVAESWQEASSGLQHLSAVGFLSRALHLPCNAVGSTWSWAGQGSGTCSFVLWLVTEAWRAQVAPLLMEPSGLQRSNMPVVRRSTPLFHN